VRRVSAVLAMACVCLGAPLHSQSAEITSVRAVLSWRVLTLTGTRTTLEHLRGRVIVVNSWATWCEPCVAELASFSALRAAVPDTLLAFALVAPQRAAPVQAFVRRRALRLPVFLEASPPPTSFNFEAVPTTWIIDRDGCIVMRHRGAAAWNTEAVRSRISALLAAPRRDAPGCG
jgi:thiol-disulfide isomerase/thioredoxin